MMEDGSLNESLPDLKDLEIKIGRKTPEGLLKWMREDALHRGEYKLNTPEKKVRDIQNKTLAEKIKYLQIEMESLHSLDVKILRQLVAVHEGMESVKWLLEERSTLASRCSSLTGSQYSLGEGPDTSLRGSWSSLQDPTDRLDNVSIGSYLDTLADDLDEYCPSSSESVLCSTPLGTEATAHPAAENPKEETQAAAEASKDGGQARPAKGHCVPDKACRQDSARACLADKLSKSQSPKLKPYKNGKVDLEGCKLNSKMRLEYDAHWRWVQSQDDVTFL